LQRSAAAHKLRRLGNLSFRTKRRPLQHKPSNLGVATNIRQRIDRLWRADSVHSRDSGGTGLGLTIAREIARGHGEAVDETGVNSLFPHGGPCWYLIRHREKSVDV
jgi:hypothetical protein